MSEVKHSHYKKDVSRLQFVDVYRVLELFNVQHPAVQHAAKKVLCAGGRGAKDWAKDIQEAIDSLQRALDMHKEDSLQAVATAAQVGPLGQMIREAVAPFEKGVK